MHRGAPSAMSDSVPRVAPLHRPSFAPPRGRLCGQQRILYIERRKRERERESEREGEGEREREKEREREREREAYQIFELPGIRAWL